jgi:hypothetical protein
MAAAPETAASEPEAASRPSLAAVFRLDEAELLDEVPAGLSADLKATVDPDDLGEAVELEASPRLAAKCAEPDLCDDGPRGHGTLEAVLIRS